MIDQSQAQQLVGRQLRTRDGDKIGTIGQVYIDDYYGQPEWVTVDTGLFGTSESFVPLARAGISGDDLVVPYTKAQIKHAPKISDSGHLTEAEEQDLYEHYNIAYTTEGSTFADATEGEQGPDYPDRPPSDSAMTRSEERLDVGTERVQSGRARLRKWVETENVQVHVPVRSEKAVLVTEPVTDANRDAALDGPAISEEEHEVVLSAERPVVSKETVAKERVRLDTEVEESVESVGDEVRKERIELVEDGEGTGMGQKRR